MLTGWVAHEGRWALLPALLDLAAAGIALALIDLDVRRLSDAIVLPAHPVTAALRGLAAVLEHDAAAAVRPLVGEPVLCGLCLALAVAGLGGTGFGDVDLAGVLGAALGCAGWSALAVVTLAAFAIGGLVGVALVATGVLRRRGHQPFGRSVVVGAASGVVTGGGLVHR